jgi:quinol monooxygenase YgiN
MIHVIVFIQVHEGKREAFIEEFQKIVPTVRAEQGCVDYQWTVDVDIPGIDMFPPPDPNRVTIIERWENVDALEAHAVAPHMAEYRPKVKDYIAAMTAASTQG